MTAEHPGLIPFGQRNESDSTLGRLRGMILSGEIPPGAIVSQLEMARRLGVSTTPLREAMRQLQAEGLLEAEHNRRPRVPELDIDDLHALYATRILLESLAIVMTVRTMTEAEVGQVQRDLAEMRRLAADGDHPRWEAVHTLFHRRLIAGATPAMQPSISNSFERSERYRRLSVLSDEPRGWAAADAEHERIVAACVAREPETAAHELASHLARTAIVLSASFAPEVDPTPVRIAVGLITDSSANTSSSNSRSR
jgi:DNA-binding GntR family transcriptional regulator